MGWVFAHVFLCHLVLLRNQPTIGLLLLSLVFTTLVVFLFSFYQPTERETILFLVLYTAFATTIHPFSADAIMVAQVALLTLFSETEDGSAFDSMEDDAVCLCGALSEP